MSSYESEDNQVVISQVGNEISTLKINTRVNVFRTTSIAISSGGGGTWVFLGGYVPPGTPYWHPVLKKFPLKLIPRSRNGPIFYTPF